MISKPNSFNAAVSQKHEGLMDILKARADATFVLETAAAALQRADRIANIDADQVLELERRSAAAETAQAERLAARIVAGAPFGEFPTDEDEENVDASLLSARRKSAISAKARQALVAAHADANAALQAAESAVAEAVDAVLIGEIVDDERWLTHHLDEATRRGAALRDFAVAAGVNGVHLPESMRTTLERLEHPLSQWMHTRIDVLKLGDSDAYAAWARRRAALIAGDSLDDHNGAKAA